MDTEETTETDPIAGEAIGPLLVAQLPMPSNSGISTLPTELILKICLEVRVYCFKCVQFVLMNVLAWELRSLLVASGKQTPQRDSRSDRLQNDEAYKHAHERRRFSGEASGDDGE